MGISLPVGGTLRARRSFAVNVPVILLQTARRHAAGLLIGTQSFPRFPQLLVTIVQLSPGVCQFLLRLLSLFQKFCQAFVIFRFTIRQLLLGVGYFLSGFCQLFIHFPDAVIQLGLSLADFCLRLFPDLFQPGGRPQFSWNFLLRAGNHFHQSEI